MMEHLLPEMRASNQEIMVKMRTNRAKVGANLKEDIKTNQVKADVSLREITEEMRAWQKEMKADQEVRDLFRKDRGPSGDNGANLTGDRV
jgi:hypothetical protein